MADQHEWAWMGHQAHYWVTCQFHLATYVGQNYLVSTIGDEMKDGEKKRLDMGADFFETLVFTARQSRANDPKTYDGCCEWVVDDGKPIESVYYGTAKEATAGHMELCRKYAAMTEPYVHENYWDDEEEE